MEFSVQMSILEKIKSGEYITKEAYGKSNVWTCFKRIVKEINGIEEVQPFIMCGKCNHIFKYDKGSSPSNLRKHRCFKDMGDIETEYSASTDTDVSNRKKSRVGVSDEIKKDITDKCVQFVTQDLRSFATVNGSGFKNLARCLVETGVKLASKKFDIDEILPHPTTVSRTLRNVHTRELERFVSGLQPLLEKGWCAATTDMWTDSKKLRNFMALTVHYLDSTWLLHN